MSVQEKIRSGLKQVGATVPTEDEKLKGPVGWYIMQVISGLEQIRARIARMSETHSLLRVRK